MLYVVDTFTALLTNFRLFRHLSRLPNIKPHYRTRFPIMMPLCPSTATSEQTHTGSPRIKPRRISAKVTR